MSLFVASYNPLMIGRTRAEKGGEKMMKTRKMKLAAALVPLALLLSGCREKAGVLNPQGPVARAQYHLIVWALIMMSLVLAVVLIIFIYVLVRFGRKKNEGFDPNNTGNRKLEIVWLIFPVIICILLMVPTVKTLFSLNNPPKATSAEPVAIHGKSLTIDVTSAQWKWFFRYPGQKIETVNYVVIPAGVPVKFRLHAYDAMNTFWVPELGGMQYTMTDMPMQLWLQADKPGNYQGRSGNYSGKGFAKMTFNVLAKSDGDFDSWVKNVKANQPGLTMKKYKSMLKPDLIHGTLTFSNYPKALEKNLDIAQMEGKDKTHSSSNMHHMKGMKGMDMDNDKKGGDSHD